MTKLALILNELWLRLHFRIMFMAFSLHDRAFVVGTVNCVRKH